VRAWLNQTEDPSLVQLARQGGPDKNYDAFVAEANRNEALCAERGVLVD